MAAKKPSKDRRTKPGVWEERFSEYKQEILKLAILGVPLAILDSVSGRISDRFLDQPWQAIVFLIPIAALGALFMRRAARADSLRIDRRTLLVLGAYILFFSVAAETRVLDWSRAPALFAQPSDRHWLLPVAWGDWRYRLVKKVDGDEIVVVLRDPTAGKTREQARAELVTVMGLAASKGAKGVAFDYYFDRESALDDLLCATVNTIGKPVVFGYGFQLAQERMTALPVPPSLQGCITPERQGHLVGFRDADYRARVIPLYFNNDHQRPALSLRLAQAISGDTPVSPPDAGLLQFIEPARPYARVRLADLLDPSTEHEADRNLLHDRFVLVAEDSVKDSFDTPFGRTPGGIIHANAAHSLLRGHYIRDGPRWVGFVSMLAFCFGLAVWCANGVPVARLVLVCIVATACFWAIAIAGILTGPQWFDAVYPTAAVWLLLPLLLVLRRVTARRSTRTAARVNG